MKSETDVAEKPWIVYLVVNAKGMFYAGVTTDLERRCLQHSGDLAGGAKALRGKGSVRPLWSHSLKNRSEAQRWEYQLKKLKRHQKQRLSEGCETVLSYLKERV